ncbi:MAG TPA: hypothetical protein VHE55_11105 [Fimbriimonadaceae bacterium]|nr:hypothetical protein [Fimbriimonadaceae bacterium]
MIAALLFLQAQFPKPFELANRVEKYYAGVRSYDDDVKVYDVDGGGHRLIADVKIHYKAPKEYRVVYRWIREGATTTATEDAKGRKRVRTVVWRHPLRGQLSAKDLDEEVFRSDATELLHLAMEPVAKPLKGPQDNEKDLVVWSETENGRRLFVEYSGGRHSDWTFYDARTGELVKTRHSWAHHMHSGDVLTVFHPRLKR